MSLLFLSIYLYNRFFRYRDFKILHATMRKWVRNPDGSVITYQIEVETKINSDELIFEEIWIQDKKYKLRLTNTEQRIVSSFAKKEVVNLDVFCECPIIKDESGQPPENEKKDAALLSYFVANKRKFLPIKGFEERINAFRLHD